MKKINKNQHGEDDCCAIYKPLLQIPTELSFKCLKLFSCYLLHCFPSIPPPLPGSNMPVPVKTLAFFAFNGIITLCPVLQAENCCLIMLMRCNMQNRLNVQCCRCSMSVAFVSPRLNFVFTSTESKYSHSL